MEGAVGGGVPALPSWAGERWGGLGGEDLGGGSEAEEGGGGGEEGVWEGEGWVGWGDGGNVG